MTSKPIRPKSPILNRPRFHNTLSVELIDLLDGLAKDSFCNSRFCTAILLQITREKNKLNYTLYHLIMELLDRWEDTYLHNLMPIAAPGAMVVRHPLQDALRNSLEDICFSYKTPEQVNEVISALFQVQRLLDSSVSAKVTGSLDVINEVSHDFFMKLLPGQIPDIRNEEINPSRR